MKKRKIIIAVLALTLALGMSAFAANPSAARASASAAGSALSGAPGAGYTRQLSRGNADRVAETGGAEVRGDRVRCNGDADCSNYVDADNDGICDNCNNPDGCDGTGCYGRGCN